MRLSESYLQDVLENHYAGTIKCAFLKNCWFSRGVAFNGSQLNEADVVIVSSNALLMSVTEVEIKKSKRDFLQDFLSFAYVHLNSEIARNRLIDYGKKNRVKLTKIEKFERMVQTPSGIVDFFNYLVPSTILDIIKRENSFVHGLILGQTLPHGLIAYVGNGKLNVEKRPRIINAHRSTPRTNEHMIWEFLMYLNRPTKNVKPVRRKRRKGT